MKSIAILSVILILGLSRIATASPYYAGIGAAVGAAAGFVVANNVDGVSKAFAVPALAVAGGIVGNQINQHLKGHHAANPYETAAPAPKPVTQAQIPDPHPGVDLIKVSIINSNGVRTDVPILRVKDKYVGPQGEPYDTLPSAEVLARKYGM